MSLTAVEESIGERLRLSQYEGCFADADAAQKLSAVLAEHQPPVAVSGLVLQQRYAKYHPKSGHLNMQVLRRWKLAWVTSCGQLMLVWVPFNCAQLLASVARLYWSQMRYAELGRMGMAARDQQLLLLLLLVILYRNDVLHAPQQHASDQLNQRYSFHQGSDFGVRPSFSRNLMVPRVSNLLVDRGIDKSSLILASAMADVTCFRHCDCGGMKRLNKVAEIGLHGIASVMELGMVLWPCIRFLDRIFGNGILLKSLEWQL